MTAAVLQGIMDAQIAAALRRQAAATADRRAVPVRIAAVAAAAVAAAINHKGNIMLEWLALGLAFIIAGGAFAMVFGKAAQLGRGEERSTPRIKRGPLDIDTEFL